MINILQTLMQDYSGKVKHFFKSNILRKKSSKYQATTDNGENEPS